MNKEQNLKEPQNQQLNIAGVSGSFFDELLKEFDKYRTQIAETPTISDRDYCLMAKAIWGCKQIIKEVERNYH